MWWWLFSLRHREQCRATQAKNLCVRMYVRARRLVVVATERALSVVAEHRIQGKRERGRESVVYVYVGMRGRQWHLCSTSLALLLVFPLVLFFTYVWFDVIVSISFLLVKRTVMIMNLSSDMIVWFLLLSFFLASLMTTNNDRVRYIDIKAKKKPENKLSSLLKTQHTVVL